MAMMKRFLLTFLLLTASAQAAAVDYTDIWFNPSESGWGVNVVQSDTFLFMTFFIYGADNKPTWFTAQVNQDASGNFNGTLFATTGTYYILPWVGVTVSPVGSASFQPQGPYTAKLVYIVNGVGTVTKIIQRQPLTTITIGGNYIGGVVITRSLCANSANGAVTANISISQPLNNVGPASVGIARADGVSCTFVGPLTQWGKLYQMTNATYNCSNGLNTTANVNELSATAHGVEGTWSANAQEGCVETGTFAGVLR
jgi:hypothetical protein